MKTMHLSNRFLEILLYLALLLAVLIFSANQGYAQLKESEVSLLKESEVSLKEADAMRIKNEGGIYVGHSEVPAYKGWWVQYRKVMRVEQVSHNPNTGEKWYHVYFSQIIPLEFTRGHDPDMIKEGWLWLPYNAEAPWKSVIIGNAFTWNLKPGFPKWNPGNVQLVKKSQGDRYLDQMNLYRDGARQYIYGIDANRNLEYDWVFTVGWSQLPPHQLTPGQTFSIAVNASAGGRLQNRYMGIVPRIDFKGLKVAYNPPTSYYRNGIFAGRSGSTGALIPNANRRHTFTVPENPTDQISMSFIIEGWGTVVTFVWEKQPVW
jgi:hypothetical protein